MKIQHLSDTHSYFPNIADDVDIVVHTGDFFPNKYYGNRNNLDADFQSHWLQERQYTIISWLKGKKFIWCSGNHDWISPVSLFLEFGIEAYDATLAPVSVNDISFYGIPYVNPVGDWNWPMNDGESELAEYNIKDDFKKHGVPQILLSHAPPYTVLDKTIRGDNIGSRIVLDLLRQYKDNIQLNLNGHCHEDNGIVKFGNIIVCNSATTKGNIFSINKNKVSHVRKE